MKHFIAIIIGFALAFVSCEKFTVTQDENLCEVSFSTNVLGEGVPMTRAISNNDVINTLKSCLPTYYNIELTNTKNGNKYSARTDETITIPSGEYTIKSTNGTFFLFSEGKWYSKGCGHNCDNDNYYFYGNNRGPFLTRGPKLKIQETTITITDSGNISLTGVFECAAFVFDTKVVETISGDIIQETFNIDFYTNFGDFGIFFGKPWDKNSNIPLTVILTPFSGLEYEKTKITFTQNDFECGKFYNLKCNTAQSTDIGFGVGVGNWSEGNL